MQAREEFLYNYTFEQNKGKSSYVSPNYPFQCPKGLQGHMRYVMITSYAKIKDTLIQS